MTAQTAHPATAAAFATDLSLAQEYVEDLAEGPRLALARAFCYRVVETWWSVVASDTQVLRALLHPFPAARLTSALSRLATRIGSSMGCLEADSAGYHIGLTYTGMLSTSYRAAHGVYYTPPPLGERLLNLAAASGVDWRTARVLDPACGGGAFLAPIARRIVEACGWCEPRIALQNVAARLRGYELDPFAAWLSQVTVDAVLLPLTVATRRPLPELVSVRDTLRSDRNGEHFDLVVGNPPYRRIRLDSPERKRFARSLFGHANLYGLFTEVAIDFAKPGGVIAFVTPTSFLAGEYYKKLRALIATEAPPVSIDFIQSRDDFFDDVLQEALLATYRRKAVVSRVAISEIAPLDETNLLVRRVGEASLPDDRSEPWILPRDRDKVPLASALETMKSRLTDWGYSVSTGPLVWNRYKAQLTTRKGRSRYPIIWAESVSANGRFSWSYERRNHAPLCEIRAGDEWMVVRSGCVLVQRTTAKEQHRRLIAAVLPDEFVALHQAVVVENHLNMIRARTSPKVSHAVLAAFLNSPIVDRAFRCVSGSVAVSAYELESLPLPAPEALGRLSELVAAGSDRETIELECEKLYGADGQTVG